MSSALPPTEQGLRRAEADRVLARDRHDRATAERNRIICELLDQPEWSLQRVADVLGVKRQWVAQIKRKAK